MMRVVLDTNILARVLSSPQGPAGALFEQLRADHLLILSAEILVELARALGYEHLRKIHGLDDAAIEELVENLEAGSLLVELPAPIPRVVPDDPDDDVIVATAVAGAADVICTRNKHFYKDVVLDYCRQNGIRILTDLDLLDELRRGVD